MSEACGQDAWFGSVNKTVSWKRLLVFLKYFNINILLLQGWRGLRGFGFKLRLLECDFGMF